MITTDDNLVQTKTNNPILSNISDPSELKRLVNFKPSLKIEDYIDSKIY